MTWPSGSTLRTSDPWGRMRLFGLCKTGSYGPLACRGGHRSRRCRRLWPRRGKLRRWLGLAWWETKLGLELWAETEVTEREREREHCCDVWRRTGRRKESYNVGVSTGLFVRLLVSGCVVNNTTVFYHSTHLRLFFTIRVAACLMRSQDQNPCWSTVPLYWVCGWTT